MPREIFSSNVKTCSGRIASLAACPKTDLALVLVVLLVLVALIVLLVLLILVVLVILIALLVVVLITLVVHRCVLLSGMVRRYFVPSRIELF